MRTLSVILLCVFFFAACTNTTEQKKETSQQSSALTAKEKQLAEKYLKVIIPKCLELSKTLKGGEEYGLSITELKKDIPEFVDSSWQIVLVYIFDDPIEKEWRWPVRDGFKTFVKSIGFTCTGGGDSMCNGTCTYIYLTTEEGSLNLHLWLSTSMTQGVVVTVNPFSKKDG